MRPFWARVRDWVCVCVWACARVCVWACARGRDCVWVCARVWSRITRHPPASGLKCNVECYGQGKVHEDILKTMSISRSAGDSGIPCVLFVYKVSRELEDLHNALQWIENNRTIRRDDLCAVVLLEKISNKHDKTAEVDHRGLFNEKTAVVRILWEQTWPWPWSYSSYKYIDRVQRGPRNWEAMKKITQSIRERNLVDRASEGHALQE